MKLNVAVVGATGLVGSTMLKVLEERDFPIENLYLYASSRSKGKIINYRGKDYEVIELSKENIKDNIDIALFSAGAKTSDEFAKYFVEKGVVVIDNSSNFRMVEDIPLIVPEVNRDKIKLEGIIANPNCSTITVMPALKALSDKYGIERVVYTTFQSVSGAGISGLNDLEANLKGEKSSKFTDQIAFNLIPSIDSFLEDSYTKEEKKMIDESRKILGLKDLKVTATCVRVPVRYSHSVSVNVELKKEFKLEDIISDLKKQEGLVVFDGNDYPMPLYIEGKDETYVGRIRRDYSIKNGLNLWIVADNIRKGAATNAVQIAQEILRIKEGDK